MSRSRTSFQILTIFLWMIVAASLVPRAFASTDFLVKPGRASYPLNMVVGPDHNLWFAEFVNGKIGQITTSGVLTEFPISGAQGLVGITSGPDGNIWFTDQFAAQIGHVSTGGNQLKRFNLPSGSYPQGIATGPDGNLWFVDQKKNGLFKIGKITPAGKITEYSVNVNAGVFQAESLEPAQITAGPDGNLWFTNSQAGGVGNPLVGKITTAGTVTTYTTADIPIAICAGPDGNLWVTESVHVAKISTSGVETEYAITGAGSDSITTGPDGNIWFTDPARLGNVTPGGQVTQFPRTQFIGFNFLSGITSAPDGALWFLGDITSNIGRFTTSGHLTNTYALNAGSQPLWTTLGPDGAVWFTEAYNDRVGRISTTGAVTTFPVKTANAGPGGIVTGSDGNLWFTEEFVDQVGKITTSGVVTEYPVGSGLWGITSGSDGNLWFTEYNSNAIARLTTSGTLTEFTLPTQNAAPFFDCPGPDGNVWFTENGASQVGWIDLTTTNITEYALPAGRAPGAITAGPDGNLWFLENTVSGAVGKITTSGALTEYAAQFQDFPEGLVAGGDGALWFDEFYPNAIGRMTTSGVYSQVPLTTRNAGGNAVSIGADGKIWVAEDFAGRMGRLSAIGGTGNSIKTTHGKPFRGAVASFTDGTPTATQANFTATINWGDGTKSAGTVTGPTGGPFKVSGSHTYKKVGTFNLVASLHDKVDNSDYEASRGKATVK